jgi:hypothetical protein
MSGVVLGICCEYQVEVHSHQGDVDEQVSVCAVCCILYNWSEGEGEEEEEVKKMEESS